MITHIGAYLGAILAAVLATPVAIRLAKSMNIIDAPGLRKVHQRPIPRIGGLAVVIAFLSIIVTAFALDGVMGKALQDVMPQAIAILIGGVCMASLGFIDDTIGLRARTKFLVQILAAVAICMFGIRIDSVSLGGIFKLDLGWFGWVITILWIVGVTNAVNFIDGLDGLAAGISTIACGSIAFFAIVTNQPVMTVLMLALMGSLTGFLFFNFHPAKVFLGDGGSLFLGFILASSSVMCAANSASITGLALPALALGVPIFDTLFSMMRRILERRSIFAPDRRHIHHRLLENGLGQRQVAILIYVATFVAAGLGTSMLIVEPTKKPVAFLCSTTLLIIFFRSAGAVQFKKSFKCLLKNISIIRQAKFEKQGFEEAELRFREATDFNAWWNAVCKSAETMRISRLFLWSYRESVWEPEMFWFKDDKQKHRKTMLVQIPIQKEIAGCRMRIDARLLVGNSLESASRRAMLFSRLIEENVFIEKQLKKKAA